MDKEAILKEVLKQARIHTGEDDHEYLVIPVHWVEKIINDQPNCEDVYPTKWAYEQLVEHHKEHHQKTEKEITKRGIEEYVGVMGLTGGPAVAVIDDILHWLDRKE